MRLLALTFALVLFSGASFADEFGDRFYAKTPSGLADFTAPPSSGGQEPALEAIAKAQDAPSNDVAGALQDIEPAAGDEAQAPAQPEKNIR